MISAIKRAKNPLIMQLKAKRTSLSNTTTIHRSLAIVKTLMHVVSASSCWRRQRWKTKILYVTWSFTVFQALVSFSLRHLRPNVTAAQLLLCWAWSEPRWLWKTFTSTLFVWNSDPTQPNRTSSCSAYSQVAGRAKVLSAFRIEPRNEVKPSLWSQQESAMETWVLYRIETPSAFHLTNT